MRGAAGDSIHLQRIARPLRELAGPKMTRQEQFIARIAPLAQAAQREYGVPASVSIAQAIEESGWGQHAPGNNYFGIQKGGANVPFITLKEAKTGRLVLLRAFESAAQCFEEHARLLATDQRYSKAMADAGDPIVFATLVGPCGYNPDPEYGTRIVKHMTNYKLQRFDLPATQQSGRAG